MGAEFVGGLTDTASGRRKYRDYLEWISASGEAAERLGFEKMSRGWMKGTKNAKKAVLEDLKDGQARRVVEAEASEMREPRSEGGLQEALRALGRDREVLGACRKGEAWKVYLARYLREAYLTPSRWIAEHLCMGAPSYVQSLVSRQRREKESKEWGFLKTWKIGLTLLFLPFIRDYALVNLKTKNPSRRNWLMRCRGIGLRYDTGAC